MRGGVWLAVALAACASAVFGLKSLETHLAASDAPAPTSTRVRLSTIPAWMPWSLASDIASGILPASADFNDPKLVQRTYDRLKACPWVRSVEQVRKQHTADPLVGILEVQARFREPLAVVLPKDGPGFAFVDEEAVRLPEEPNRPGAARWAGKLPATAERPAREVHYWDRAEAPAGVTVRRVIYVAIEGVQADPPPPGMKWPGADIADGVRLAGLLRPKPYFAQVVSIDVRNYGGRVQGNSGKAHIVIHVRGRNGETVEVWFGRFPAPHGDYVLSAERRLANLEEYLARYGGFFGAHRRVDLQYDRVHVE
jgi:hypothetical protein